MSDDDTKYTAPKELTKGDDFCGVGPLETDQHDTMTAACAWHDNQYINQKLHGGEGLRAGIDSEFLDKMLTLNDFHDGGTLGAVKAYTYYGLVRAFGWIPWWFNRNNGS